MSAVKTIGIIGGGQLGLMIIEQAHLLGARTICLDPAEDAPAFKISDERIVGRFDDPAALEELCRRSDVVTYEFENVPGSVLIPLEKRYNIPQGFRPLFDSQDRLRESLAQAAELLGPRAVAVCRELTKTHEEFILGRLEKWQELPEELLGEITVIIGPPEQKERADEAEARRALEAVMAAADERLKPKEVARRAQEMAPGWSAKELYELLTRA